MQRRDLAKEAYWRREFADWEKSGLSGAAYCRKRGIPYQQFKDWQKRIRRLDAASGQHKVPSIRQSAPGPVTAPGRSKIKGNLAERTADFAEVHVVEPRQKQESSKPQRSTSCTKLEIVLRNGIVLRLDADTSLTILPAVISMLEAQ